MFAEECLEGIYGEATGDGSKALPLPETWAMMQAQWIAFRSARGTGDVPAMTAAVNLIGDLIEAGSNRAQYQGKLLDIVERRKRLVEAERKRLSDEEYSISVEVFLAFIGQMMMLINSLFDDQVAKRELVRQVQGLIGSGRLPSTATAEL